MPSKHFESYFFFTFFFCLFQPIVIVVSLYSFFSLLFFRGHIMWIVLTRAHEVPLACTRAFAYCAYSYKYQLDNEKRWTLMSLLHVRIMFAFFFSYLTSQFVLSGWCSPCLSTFYIFIYNNLNTCICPQLIVITHITAAVIIIAGL